MKKRLSQSEEFEIMKLVMDKFLWLGTLGMGYGLYKSIAESITSGIYFIIAGVVISFLFVIIMIKEYEMLK
ncbi:MAG: hypothetical protein ACLFP2_06035 [Candidatus Woesearchaeota archaeon]